MALPVIGGSDGAWGTVINTFLGGAAGDGTPTIPSNSIPYFSGGNHTSSANLTFDGTVLTITNLVVSVDLSLDDAVEITLGTGNDAQIFYDGTNLVINPMARP